jgi:hypothetical protein
MLCSGNFSEFCGGSSRLDVYDYNHSVSLPPWTTTTTSMTSKATSTSSTVPPSTTPSQFSTSSSSQSSPTQPATTATSQSSTAQSATSTNSNSASQSSTQSATSGTFGIISSSTSITSSSASAVQSLAIKPTVGAYTFLGCWTEATSMRALSGSSYYDYLAMTLEKCAGDCVGYTYFGVEYGGECMQPVPSL